MDARNAVIAIICDLDLKILRQGHMTKMKYASQLSGLFSDHVDQF